VSENGLWIKSTTPSLLNRSSTSISNDLYGTEDDDVLWAEQYDKSDTDSDEEGDNMYDDTRTDTTDMFIEEKIIFILNQYC